MFGEEIIKILDALCEKFGMAIDWTATNVAPYLEELCGKVINFEIMTSIFWIILTGAIMIIFWIVSIILLNTMSGNWNSYDFEGTEILAVLFTVASIITSIIFVVIAGTQIYDIIMCNTIPEAMVLRYVENIMINLS